MRMEKGGLLMNAICVLFILSLQCKLSLVSVVFDFNASLSDVAPLSSMMFTVDLMRMEKSELLMNILLYVVSECELQRLSLVSVVFDFSASLNDAAPVSPILLPVNLIKKRMVC